MLKDQQPICGTGAWCYDLACPLLTNSVCKDSISNLVQVALLTSLSLSEFDRVSSRGTNCVFTTVIMPLPAPLKVMGLVAGLDATDAPCVLRCCNGLCGEADASSIGAPS